jgi:hypothetical protein
LPEVFEAVLSSNVLARFQRSFLDEVGAQIKTAFASVTSDNGALNFSSHLKPCFQCGKIGRHASDGMPEIDLS